MRLDLVEVPEVAVDPVDQHEAREDGHEEERGHRQTGDAEESQLHQLGERRERRAWRQFDAGPLHEAAGDPSHVSPRGTWQPEASADNPPRQAPAPTAVLSSRTAYDSTTASRSMRTGPSTSSPRSARAFAIWTIMPMFAPGSTVRRSGACKSSESI